MTIVDGARKRPELAPVLAAPGGNQVSLDIGSDVLAEMLGGNIRDVSGRKIGPFAWKFNRFPAMPNPIVGTVMSSIGGNGTFLTNSWQQDYAVPGMVLLGWIESAHAININQQSQPKDVIKLEVRRELEKEYLSTSSPSKVCWLANDQRDYGIWGQAAISNATGLTNPGPNVVYTFPLGAGATPNNPSTQIVDANGNLWVLTTYGTCGAALPAFPASPNFPSYGNPLAAATVTDGTCVWTAVNPKGQGFRICPLPPQTGVVWLIRVVGQLRPPAFTSLQQTLEPIPDDWTRYFRDGFLAQCYRHSVDAKVRMKFDKEYQLWLLGMEAALRQGNQEQNDFGFYPERSIMDVGYQQVGPTPAWPWPGRVG
jgi:hypothetical protein